MLKLESGNILATTDHFGSGFHEAPNVSVFLSRDNGSTWSFQAWIVSQYWSNLFQLDPSSNDVYIIGTNNSRPSPAKISCSHDGGLTWDSTHSAILATGTPGTHATAGFETGPTPALIASDGRIYRAMELMPPPAIWPNSYQAVMLSANRSENLLDPANWRISTPLPFDVSWIPSSWGPVINPGYLEGNAVEGPHGEIYNILRLNSKPVAGNKAVVLQYNLSTNTLQFRTMIDLPGGHSKFVIHRDPQTKLYITLSNNNTVLNDPNFEDQRNVLTLSVSTDVENWDIVGTLLMDDSGFSLEDSVRFTGFHYVDWHIDGDDLIYLVRTAYRGAVSYHNSNRITFKRLPNFRSYLPGFSAKIAKVNISGTGFSIAVLENGAVAFSNREYQWEDVPPTLLQTPPLQFTKLSGGVLASISANVISMGTLYVATADFTVSNALENAGFTLLDQMLMSMKYTDTGNTRLHFFSKLVYPNETTVVPQAGWAGCILIGNLGMTE